jgi:hypothetical protein
MARIVDYVASITQKAGINHWNDMDILDVSSSFHPPVVSEIPNATNQVGNGGMTKDEYSEYLRYVLWLRI